MERFTVDEALRLAQEHHLAGRLREAETLYREILQRQPEQPAALHHLGVIAHQLRRPDLAIPLLERSVALQPAVAYFHKNLGAAYQAAERFADAERSYREAAELTPQDAEPHHGLGVALEKQERIDEAAAEYQKALDLQPDHPAANHNLGMLTLRRGRYEESLPYFDRAIAARPNYALARLSRAATSLRLGRFAEGWEDYEWRFQTTKLPTRRPDPRFPIWQGEDLAGRTLLVRAEQGLGDTIFMMRYMPLLAARGARVVMEVQPPIKSLASRMEGVQQVIATDEAPPPFDFQVMLMSLPRLFGTRVETAPAPVPYVHPDETRAAAWRTRLAGDAGLRIGVVWRVGPKQPDARNRSLRLADLAPLARRGVTFYSLQKEDPDHEAASPPASMRLVDLSAELHDFEDTAAALAPLDLVITADTAVVNLAGAMGMPTWVFVPFLADWRWLLDRDDCPWYPTVRVFRRESEGDVEALVLKMARALDALARSSAACDV